MRDGSAHGLKILRFPETEGSFTDERIPVHITQAIYRRHPVI